MSVEDDDWATAVDIQEGITKVEINESAKQEGDEFTTSYGEDQVNQGDQSFFTKSITPKTSHYSKRTRSTTT